MNAEALDFEDESFDLAFGSGILHHLQLSKALPEIERVLRPGGRVIFSEPTGHNPVINLYRRFTPGQRTEDEHPLLSDDFAVLRYAFSEVHLYSFHLTSLAALALLETRWFDPLADGLEGLDQWIFRRRPSWSRFGWMVVIDGRKRV